MASRIAFLLLPVLMLHAGTARADDLARARAEILPLHEAMQIAANDHDVEKHLAYYVREPDLMFIINDRMVVGYDELVKSQRRAWKDGKSDVVYSVEGEPDFRMPADGLIMLTYFLKSHRTEPDGSTMHSRFSVSMLWQRRPEGWRITYAHESKVNLPQSEGANRE